MTTKTKKALRHNLPHDTKYTIIETYSLGEDDFTSCMNCNKAIKHVAIVENTEGKQYHIGMECAKTLIGLGLEEWEIEKARTPFNEAKTFLAKVNRHKKKYPNFRMSFYHDRERGNLMLQMYENQHISSNLGWQTFSIDFVKKYLPNIAKTININYDSEILDYDKNEYFSFDKRSYQNFTIDIEVETFTKEQNNYTKAKYNINIFADGNLIGNTYTSIFHSNTDHPHKSINANVCREISKYLYKQTARPLV